MKIEEAIKWMEEAIQDTKEFFDQCSPALQEELTKQKEVFELAIAALRPMSGAEEYHFREATEMVLLTVEQLREMKGKPVLIRELANDKKYCAIIQLVSEIGVNMFDEEYGEDYGSLSLYGKTWLAYSYPPVHIDRGEWDGCDCDKPKSCCTCCSMQCHRCIGQSEYKQAAYCMKCGKPQTEKAWAELERRFQKVTRWMPLPVPPEVKDHG